MYTCLYKVDPHHSRRCQDTGTKVTEVHASRYSKKLKVSGYLNQESRFFRLVRMLGENLCNSRSALHLEHSKRWQPKQNRQTVSSKLSPVALGCSGHFRQSTLTNAQALNLLSRLARLSRLSRFSTPWYVLGDSNMARPLLSGHPERGTTILIS